MTRTASALLLILLLTARAQAGGISPMSLQHTLLYCDVIILVEIVENKETVTKKEPAKGTTDFFGGSITYDNDIKSKVISVQAGEFKQPEYNTRCTEVFLPRAWVSSTRSGVERQMQPGEKYVFLLKKVYEGYDLQRAEPAEKLDEVVGLKKERDAADQQVAEAQAKLANGIYPIMDVDTKGGQKVRLVGGDRYRIGERRDLEIVGCELAERYNLFLLSLTLTEKPGYCVLLLDGQAYRLFDHHGFATPRAAGAKLPPMLYCGFKDRETAIAAGKFFDVTLQVQPPKAAKPAEVK